MRKTKTLTFLIFTLAAVTVAACSNSILRNVTEAGVETALEGPLPTPTVGRAQPNRP